MLGAPRQDWPLYAALSREADAAWIRSLSTAERFALYADLFNAVWLAKRDTAENESLEEARWQGKLRLRQRMHRAFSALDERRRGQAATDHAG